MKSLVAVVTFAAVLLLASAWGDGGQLGAIAAPARAQETDGKIAFVSDRDGNSEIYVMDADGSNQTNLTNNPALRDRFPTWSPDGSRIAFSSDRDRDVEIYVMNADGSGQTNLTNNPAGDFGPVWSPDGGRIAFVSDRDGNLEIFEIYVMNADGSGQTNITDATGGRDPVWSPDGSRIAFTSGPDIFVMNADGSGQTNITDSPEFFAFYRQSAWSPDGSRIAFDSIRDGLNDILAVNADGSGGANLTNNPAFNTTAAWSPDGSRIAFNSDVVLSGNKEIYVMNADGSDQINLSNNPDNDISPAWSPDGSRILFISLRDDPNPSTCSPSCNYEVYIMNADGSGQIRLTNNPSSDGFFGLAWSPLATAEPTPTPEPAEPTPQPVEPTSEPFEPAPEPPATEGPPQTEFVDSVPGPDQISTDPDVVGSNITLTLFVIFAFAFTSAIFNQTLASNRQEIEGWVGRFFNPFRRVSGIVEQRYGAVAERRPWVQRVAGPAVILVLTGLVYGFLSPDFGFNTKSIVLFLSLVVGVGVITYVFAGGEVLFARRRLGLRAGVKLYAVALAIAVGSVLVSRLVNFQPGFIFGFVASYTLLAPAALDRKQDGQAAFFPAIALLALSLIAWGLLIPLREVTQESGNSWLGLPEGTAVAVFVAGLQGLFFSLIPLSFMHGARIAQWNRLLWLLMFGVAGFLFWHVFLNPEGAYLEVVEQSRVIAALALLSFYTIVTLVAWVYFRGRVYGWHIPSPVGGSGRGGPPPPGILEFARRWGGRPIARLVLGAGAIAAVMAITVFVVLSGDGDGNPPIVEGNPPIVGGNPTATVTPNPTPEDTATPTPDGGTEVLAETAEMDMIAFRSDRDDNLEIYVMNDDGSDPKRLTRNAVDDFVGSWSPDGRSIAFDSNRDGNFEIYVMDDEGSIVSRLTEDAAHDGAAAWAPDGSRIAFVSNRDGDDDIYVINLDGSGLSNLTKNDNISDGDPAWSHDGSRIAFQSDRDGNFEIYVMNADGSDLKQLTDNTAIDRASAWSPDGRSIAFDSNRDGNFEIYVMDDEGSFVSRLTEDAANDGAAAWSPDGSRIAFVSNRDGDFEIYVMNADGSHVINLTNNQALDAGPEWSPAP